MIQDLRFALRMIATHRWFSLAVIVTLALGIGINTTVFTLVNAVIFKPVPIPGGERLVTIINQDPARPRDWEGVSYPDFLEYRAQHRSFDGFEAGSNQEATLSDPNIPPQRYDMMRISPGLFGMLQTPPLLGRGFSPDDAKPGAPAVALIAHSVWQSRYAGADIIGRSVRLNGAPATIVGVMPPGFKFPSNQEVWTPLVPDAALAQRSQRPLMFFGLLKPGVTVAMANQDLNVIAARLAHAFPETNRNFRALVRSFHQTYNGEQVRGVFLLLLGAVMCVLLIACANVANLMLSRGVARSREIAVRVAMGASRWQVVRQLLVESVLLSSLGGLLGFGLARAGAHALDVSMRDIGKPYWVQFDMNYAVFVYFAAVSVLSGIAFGLVPALRASRIDLNTTLKDGAPAGGSHRGGRLTSALVVLQFALTVVLLAGAGMMMRSFFAAQTINPFVRAESLLVARLQLPEAKGERYESPQTRLHFYEQVLPRLAALPGVTHVGVASNPPGLGANTRDLELEGQPPADPKLRPRASVVVQSTDYLPTIGLPLLAGRSFDETDGEPGKETTVVTRAFAAKYWPGEAPLGKRFRFVENEKPGPWLTVIGVSADLTQELLGNAPPPLVFVSYRQEPWGWMTLVLRTASDPTTLAMPVRTAVQNLDQDLPLSDVASLPALLARERWFLAVFGTLFLVFAITGLVIAAIGVYSVIAQTTMRRTREIGIRMALGATAARILRLVLARGVVQLGLGLALGLGGALGATRLMGSLGLLVGVSANDPLVFVAIVALLLTIGLFACWLPARRAAALEPVAALRHE